MSVQHPHIVSYIKLMNSKKLWYAEDEPTSLWERCKRVYLHARIILFGVLLAENAVGLYFLEGFGIFDGSFLYLPVALQLVVLNTMTYYSRKSLHRLTATLNKHFVESNEPWMLTISNSYTDPLWKVVRYVQIYDIFAKIFYFASPFIADTILHHVFDVLEKPLYLPTFITPWLPANVTWNPQYYTVIALGWWSLIETMSVVIGFILSYSIMLTYVLIQVVIFKEKVKAAKLDGPKREVDAEFKSLLAWHIDNIHYCILVTYILIQVVIFKEKVKAAKLNGLKKEVDADFRSSSAWHIDNLQLNRDLKAFLGLPCAFQTLFLSFTLTLCLFTAVTSTDVVVRMAYTASFLFYFYTGLLYCTLGQLLENESNELFYALYNLPWHQCSPNVRKSLNMIMRQSHKSLILDYHGRFKMNFANFMTILKEAYSYFTLLRSMTE